MSISSSFSLSRRITSLLLLPIQSRSSSTTSLGRRNISLLHQCSILLPNRSKTLSYNSSLRSMSSTSRSYSSLLTSNYENKSQNPQKSNQMIIQRTFIMNYWEKLKGFVDHFSKNNVFTKGTQMYNSCQEQAFNADWFSKGRVTPDFRGKLILVTLHVWLVNRRLLKLQEITSSTLRLQETLFDQMWEYSAAVIKELKVYRQQRSLEQAQYFAFYICNDLDEALALMDEEKIIDEFGGIIWNKLYRREDLPEDHVMEVARYLYREYKNIDRMTDEEFLTVTKFPWGPIPEWKEVNKKVRAGKGHPNRVWPEEEPENNQ